MARTLKRQVSVAKVNRRSLTLLDHDWSEDLLAALDPDRTTVRYNRRWRLSQPEVRDGYVQGQLGFVRPSAVESVDYNEAEHRYQVEAGWAVAGSFTHFVIDLGSQLMAFEERPPDIRRQSFLGAFKSLMDSSATPFDLELVSDPRSLDAWLSDVETVTRFHATIHPPNPEWRDRVEEVRQIVTSTNADPLTIEAKSDPGQDGRGLNIKETVLEGVADHAAAGNGRYRLTGLKASSRRFFDSARRLVTGEFHLSADDWEDTIYERLKSTLQQLLPTVFPADDDSTTQGQP